MAKKLPEHIKSRVSAMLLTEKVRDDGTRLASYLEWDATRGAVYDLSTMQHSHEYEKRGYWTRAISKYSQEDRPNHNKGAGRG